MQITARSQAKLLFQNTYYTGQPCKHGHIAYRYTQSGACSACHKDDHAAISNPAVKLAKIKMIKFRVRIFDQDVLTFQNIALGAAMMHEPGLGPHDVFVTQSSHREAGAALYNFYCFLDDLVGLQGAANQLFSARCCKVVQPPPAYQPPTEEWPELNCK